MNAPKTFTAREIAEAFSRQTQPTHGRIHTDAEPGDRVAAARAEMLRRHSNLFNR